MAKLSYNDSNAPGNPLWGYSVAADMMDKGFRGARDALSDYSTAVSERELAAFQTAIANANKAGQMQQFNPQDYLKSSWAAADTSKKMLDAKKLKEDALELTGMDALKAIYGTEDNLQRMYSGELTKDEVMQNLIQSGEINKEASAEAVYNKLLTDATANNTLEEQFRTNTDKVALRKLTEDVSNNPELAKQLATGQITADQLATQYNMRPEAAKTQIDSYATKFTQDMATQTQQEQNAAALISQQLRKGITPDDEVAYATGGKTLADFRRENPQLTPEQSQLIFQDIVKDVETKGGTLSESQTAALQSHVTPLEAQLDNAAELAKQNYYADEGFEGLHSRLMTAKPIVDLKEATPDLVRTIVNEHKMLDTEDAMEFLADIQTAVANTNIPLTKELVLALLYEVPLDQDWVGEEQFSWDKVNGHKDIGRTKLFSSLDTLYSNPAKLGQIRQELKAIDEQTAAFKRSLSKEFQEEMIRANMNRRRIDKSTGKPIEFEKLGNDLLSGYLSNYKTATRAPKIFD
jgi:hypothetical protein